MKVFVFFGLAALKDRNPQIPREPDARTFGRVPLVNEVCEDDQIPLGGVLVNDAWHARQPVYLRGKKPPPTAPDNPALPSVRPEYVNGIMDAVRFHTQLERLKFRSLAVNGKQFFEARIGL